MLHRPLVGFALLAVSTPAAAAMCSSWGASLGVLGSNSSSIRLDWTAPPASCGNTSGGAWTGTHHLELHRADGSTAPSSPSSGSLVASMPPSAFDHRDVMHRSSKEFSYQIFACMDASCSAWYADGTRSDESSTGTTKSQATEAETWVISGMTSETDLTYAVVDDPDANAPHAFFYPSGWSTGYSEKLAIYYSYAGNSVDASQVWHLLHDATGWPSVGFNASTDWATSATLVAEGSTTPSASSATDPCDDDHGADHPWAMLTNDGSNNRVQLFVQNQSDPTWCTIDHHQAIQIESTDEAGTAFGMGCSGTSCTSTFLDAGGYVTVAADGTSTTDWVNHVRHCRVGTDYIIDPVVDAGTDEPLMMIQMERNWSGTCADSPTGGAPNYWDDIGRADGAWNSSTSQWDWSVDVDSSSPYCPVVHVVDAHDNTMIPLPGGEIKMYVKDWATHDWYVIYWDGSGWVDKAVIEFWYDGATQPDSECIENPAALAYAAGGGVFHEGMFFLLMDSDTGCGAGRDDDILTIVDDAAIMFAEHSN